MPFYSTSISTTSTARYANGPPASVAFFKRRQTKNIFAFTERHKFRHQRKSQYVNGGAQNSAVYRGVVRCCPKFLLLPLGRAIHNGAGFSMFSDEFSRLAGGAVLQSGYQAIHRKDFFCCEICGKTGLNHQQMAINAGKAALHPNQPFLSCFFQKVHFCPQKLVAHLVPLFLQDFPDLGPRHSFSWEFFSFMCLNATAKK